MPSRDEIFRAIYGAYRLARLDRGGMNHFDLSIVGFWHSFFAAAVVLPFYIVMIFGPLGGFAEGTAGPELYLLVKLGGYAIGWAIFPVAMIFLARLLSLSANYVPYIIVHNWSATIQIAVLLPAFLLTSSEGVPEGPAALVLMLSIVAVLFYQWYVARVALRTSGLTAAGVVVFDVLLTEFIELGGERLLH